jgi:hypothetical protein
MHQAPAPARPAIASRLGRNAMKLATVATTTVALLVLGLISGAVVTSAGEANSAWLITPDEAALAEAPAGTASVPTLRGRAAVNNGGPIVEMVTPPDEKPVHSPATVFIRFAPNRAPIDLATLKVTLVKIIKIDITKRLAPYTTVEGIHITDGRIPSGHFRLRLSIADVKGNVTTGEGELNIL